MHIFFKKVLQNLLPPICYKLYQHLILKKSRYTFTDIYNSFETAKTASKQNSIYLNKDLDKIAIDETYSVLFKKNIYARSDQRKGLLIEILLKLKFPKEKATIVDFGGGNYPQYAYLSPVLRDQHNHVVIDRRDLIGLINYDNRFSRLPSNLKFIDLVEFKAEKVNIDIVYFGSTIQYLDDLMSYIYTISKKGCKYVIICESTFTDMDDDIFVLQRNVPPSVFPNKWHSKNKLIQNMKNMGFELIFENQRRHNYKHNIINQNDFFYQTFIFEKLDNSLAKKNLMR